MLYTYKIIIWSDCSHVMLLLILFTDMQSKSLISICCIKILVDPWPDVECSEPERTQSNSPESGGVVIDPTYDR